MKKPPRETDLNVGQNIRALRMARGISQEKLGEALGITFQQIQKYEKGTNRVGASRLSDIAAFLGVEISALFQGSKQAEGTGTVPVLSSQAMRLGMAFDTITAPAARRAILDLAKLFAQADPEDDTGSIAKGNALKAVA